VKTSRICYLEFTVKHPANTAKTDVFAVEEVRMGERSRSDYFSCMAEGSEVQRAVCFDFSAILEC
jgi:hypothetical protein